MVSADLLLVYGIGVVVFALIIDEPWPARLALASLWPLSLAIFLLVVVSLLLVAAVAWWPLGLLLAGAVGGLLWWLRA